MKTWHWIAIGVGAYLLLSRKGITLARPAYGYGYGAAGQGGGGSAGSGANGRPQSIDYGLVGAQIAGNLGSQIVGGLFKELGSNGSGGGGGDDGSADYSSTGNSPLGDPYSNESGDFSTANDPGFDSGSLDDLSGID